MGKSCPKHYLLLSGIVVAVAVSAAFGLSFSNHAYNVLATILAVICGGAIAALSFQLRPSLLGVTVGVLSTLGWLLVLAVFALGLMFDGNSTATAELENGSHCRETAYGFVTGDSGTKLEVFRRYFFIDRQIGQQVNSDIYPEETRENSEDVADSINRCKISIKKMRSATKPT